MGTLQPPRDRAMGPAISSGEVRRLRRLSRIRCHASSLSALSTIRTATLPGDCPKHVSSQPCQNDVILPDLMAGVWASGEWDQREGLVHGRDLPALLAGTCHCGAYNGSFNPGPPLLWMPADRWLLREFRSSRGHFIDSRSSVVQLLSTGAAAAACDRMRATLPPTFANATAALSSE
jgi:hypothetical protein